MKQYLFPALLLASLTASAQEVKEEKIKEKVAPLIKGGGGGQKTLATAGGQDSSQLVDVIKAIQETL